MGGLLSRLCGSATLHRLEPASFSALVCAAKTARARLSRPDPLLAPFSRLIMLAILAGRKGKN
jgi:hypothetical protein